MRNVNAARVAHRGPPRWRRLEPRNAGTLGRRGCGEPAEPEGDAVVPDRHDLRRIAVDQPQADIVRPADAVAGAELHALRPVDLDRATLRADLARPLGDELLRRSFQRHRALPVVDPCDAALVSLATPSLL